MKSNASAGSVDQRAWRDGYKASSTARSLPAFSPTPHRPDSCLTRPHRALLPQPSKRGSFVIRYNHPDSLLVDCLCASLLLTSITAGTPGRSSLPHWILSHVALGSGATCQETTDSRRTVFLRRAVHLHCLVSGPRAVQQHRLSVCAQETKAE